MSPQMAARVNSMVRVCGCVHGHALLQLLWNLPFLLSDYLLRCVEACFVCTIACLLLPL